MANTKLSQIATGGAVAGATDLLIAVRSGTTDVQVIPVTLDLAQQWAAVQTYPVGYLSLLGSSTGYTLLESGNAGATNYTATLPANTGMIAELNLAQTWTAAQTFTNGDLLLKGSSSGSMTLEAPAVASTYVITFPAATDTVAVIGTAQTFTAAQTFTNSDLKLLGSSSGATTFTSANASSNNYTATFPANTGTVAELNLAQSWTAAQTFNNSNIILLGSSTGFTTFASNNASSTNYTLNIPAANGTLSVATAPVLVGSSAAAVGGGKYLLNTASGSILTLPAATGSGLAIDAIVTTATTSNAHKILAASTSDFIIGTAVGQHSNTPLMFVSTNATNHSIQMPFAGTQPSGGLIGDKFTFIDIAANLWQCNGFYSAGTTPTTPFNTADS